MTFIRSKQKFLFILTIMWVLTQLIKALVLTDYMLHGSLAVLFLLGSFVVFPRWVKFFCSPDKFFGLTMTGVYLAVTILVFMLYLYQHNQLSLFFTEAGFALVKKDLLPRLLSSQRIIASTAVPLYEEIFFRGALFFGAMGFLHSARFVFQTKIPGQTITFLLAAYFSSLVFWIFHFPAQLSIWHRAFLHGGLPISPGPFFLGLICAWIAYKDRSFFMAVVFHGCANFLAPIWIVTLEKSQWLGIFYI